MKSINKALDILESFLENENRELRLSEICESTRLNRSTANRIVSILVKRGYLYQKEKRGKYSLNLKFLNYSAIILRGLNIQEIATPYLLELGNSVGECITLTVRDVDNAFVIVVVESNNVLKTEFEMGDKIPLYCSAVGKIFLADMTQQELEQYLKNTNLEKLTSNTITDYQLLRVSLKIIKEECVAYDYCEQHEGVNSVAVPVRNIVGKSFASVGVVGPSVRLTQNRITEIVPDLKHYGLEISKACGYLSQK